MERVIFVGNYLCGNKMSMQMLAYAMDYWSKNTIKALFLEHEGLLWCTGQHAVPSGPRLCPVRKLNFKILSTQHSRAMIDSFFFINQLTLVTLVFTVIKMHY